ncbi:SulP family inorganic anion transporter [Terribacillus sp. DMT04]|uniref:SulP family inorganic anion transporter n=1 Tax=Terribacillus sp. DMT04 TaxID=2850441 RepID=UPI0020B772FE|nr:SulP family inorganic anion transporter [Terribacillus sp. DMT04]
MKAQTWRHSWFGNSIKTEVLSGIVIALALIPESIAFSVIAGVDPMVGMYGSVCIAIMISLVGGRPGMISAATGAQALLIVGLVADHGLQYLLAATILAGIFQILFGIFKLSRFLKFISSSVVTGFVNALAILYFISQIEHFEGATWIMYAFVALTLAIIYIFPRITKAVPSPLVAIIIVTAVSIYLHADVNTVGDMGSLSQTLPTFLFPQIPLTMETFLIILPYSLAMMIVGLLESLLTATILDETTNTSSNKNMESRGQGIANITAGFFGGLPGCAMIGQSVINVSLGARGRLSTLVAGGFLMILILLFTDVVNQIPMAAIVGIMLMVAISTMDWRSVRTIHKVSKADAFTMIITVALVVYTHNLAIGVLAGVILSAFFFMLKVSNFSKIKTTTELSQNGTKKTYFVRGQLFFVTSPALMEEFDYNDTVESVDIDFTNAIIWDNSAVEGLNKVKEKFEQNNISVTIIGLDSTNYFHKEEIVRS